MALTTKTKTTGPAPLPTWIEADPAWTRDLTAHQRRTLKALRDRADWTPFTGGTLGVAIAGEDFPEEAGVSTAGYYRHAAILEGLGYIRCIGRLGRQGAKCWALPGSRGCVDAMDPEYRYRSIHEARQALLQVCDAYSNEQGELTKPDRNCDAYSKTYGDAYSNEQASFQNENDAYSNKNGAYSKTQQPFSTLQNLTEDPLASPTATEGELAAAIKQLFGFDPVTETDQRRLRRWVKDITAKANAVGMKPVKALTRAKAEFKARWPDASVTPDACLKHWSSLLANKVAGVVVEDDPVEVAAREARRAEAERQRALLDEQYRREEDEKRRRREACPHDLADREPTRGNYGSWCKACGKTFTQPFVPQAASVAEGVV